MFLILPRNCSNVEAQHRRSNINTQSLRIAEENIGYRNHQQPHPYHTQNMRLITTISATDDGRGKSQLVYITPTDTLSKTENKYGNNNRNEQWSQIQSSISILPPLVINFGTMRLFHRW